MNISLARIRSYHVHSMARVIMPHSFKVWSLLDPPLARLHHLPIVPLSASRHSTAIRLVVHRDLRRLDETRIPEDGPNHPHHQKIPSLPWISTQRSPVIVIQARRCQGWAEWVGWVDATM